MQGINRPILFRTKRLSLLLLVNKLEMLGALEGVVGLVLALDTLETEHNLLGGLSLLVEDRLGLTTVALLLAVVTTLTLGVQRSLTSLVLGHLVNGVLLAVLGCAESLLGLRDGHHCCSPMYSALV